MRSSLVLIFLFSFGAVAFAQTDKVDTALMSRIRWEGTTRSQVMTILKMITDIHGPRLMNSEGYRRAAEYARTQMTSWGLKNVHFDAWDESFGKGWNLKKFSLQGYSDGFLPLIAYPKAWSPGVKGNAKGEAVFLEVYRESDLAKYKGKLKGKFVLFSLPQRVKPGFAPDASRLTDSLLLQFANASPSEAYTARKFPFNTEPQRLAYLKWKLCQDEGAIAIVEISPGLKSKDGTLMVHSATVPYPADYPSSKRLAAYDKDAPTILPQIVVATEHYNRMIRLIEAGKKIELTLTLDVEFTPAAPGYNIIGEIPGTDLKDEVVMIGAHFDSWHSGTGATDNGCGSAVMMEAMRILQSLNISPRRTIRIALWGGEEQGLLGSRSYVRRFLGARLDNSFPYDSIRLKPAAEKFSVYFNMDLGNGRFRGIYAQGNEKAAPIFRSWLRPFAREGISTVTLKNISGTDHLTFDALGLPAFQFVQDPIEYGGRTYHTNKDTFDRVVENDLKTNAVVTALFAWMAANRDELMPRR
jgi:hypothetical protein